MTVQIFVTICNSIAIISTATLMWKHRKDGHGG